MKHVTIESFDIPDAWFKAVSTIWNQGEIFVVGHGSECTETKKLDVTIHISHPENLPYVADKAPTDMKHVQEYGLTYLYTSFKGDHPYTYGSRLREIVDQVYEIIKAIVKDPRNRQLTMTIRIPEDVTNPEPPCLTMMDIEILNGRVNLTCYFRSWDAYGALNENIAGIFIFLQALVNDVNEILIAEGKSDNELLSTGEMIFHSKNCHIYERCYPYVEELLLLKKEQKRKTYI